VTPRRWRPSRRPTTRNRSAPRASHGLVLGGLLAALAASSEAHAGPGRTIDYVYVEANEAGSSGGHAAIRFGDRVFHFQYAGNGLLGISREDFEGFRRHYALLENRAIRVIPIPVSDETFEIVHGHFARRRIVQHQHGQILDSLAADRRLLQAFHARSRGEPAAPVLVEGAGYLVGPDEAAARAEPSSSLEMLRDRIAAAHGPGYLDERLAAVRRQLEALDPRTVDGPELEVSMERMPAAVYGFARRYHDAQAARLALEAIQRGRGLLPGTYLDTGHPELALAEGEGAAVDAMAAALAQSLVRLARSERPDWGPALLVGLARLDALEKARRSGSWVFLDVFPADARALGRTRLARRPQLLETLLREARADFAAARARLLESRPGRPGFREQDFSDLEEAGNRLIESLRARHRGRDLRLAPGRQVPARRAPLAEVVVPRPAAAALDEELGATVAREADYAERLQRLYGYHLLTRNCVTEIFREIDRALAPHAAGEAGAARAESQRRLGGHVEMGGLRFIPAVSASAAEDTYAVLPPIEIPSHRRASLARLYREESPLRVFLRESNTLTSTLYERHPDDSYFLFFTDDVVAARPLFGMANLLTGLGATVAGAVTWPVDRGQTLWAGLKGMAFSLPELFFFNIRKGSFDHVAGESGLE
jgi:hypothetical protein